MDLRRKHVASLRVRQFAIRDIVAALPEMRCINEETGKPWGLATIHADLVAIETQWRESAAADIAIHKGNLNAELDEVKRVSWKASDMQNVLAAIKQQRDLLGTDAPKRTEIGGIPDGEPIRTQSSSVLEGIDLGSLSIKELEALELAVNTLDGLRKNSEAPSGEKP